MPNSLFETKNEEIILSIFRLVRQHSDFLILPTQINIALDTDSLTDLSILNICKWKCDIKTLTSHLQDTENPKHKLTSSFYRNTGPF